MKLKLLQTLSKEERENFGYPSNGGLEHATYAEEVSVLIRYKQPGKKVLTVSAYNPTSSIRQQFKSKVLATVERISFAFGEPPVANRTKNITFTIEQVIFCNHFWMRLVACNVFEK